MQLIKYDEACRAIAVCLSVDEAKDISDKSLALQAYARQSSNLELERTAAEIRLRAKRRIGEISKSLETAPSGRAAVSLPEAGKSKTKTLADAGVSTSEAHRCEKLATVPVDDFERYIAKSHDSGRTVSSDEVLKRVTKTVSRSARVNAINAKNAALPTEVYSVIYADPPWRYHNVVSEDRRIENHYPTMSLDDICDLPVAGIAAADSLLYLWATVAELPGALRVMNAWGFEYKSHAVWVKPSIGIGFWFRSQHELLLLGTRGSMPTPIEALRHSSVFESPTGAHSAKPKIVRDWIDSAYGDFPRIELFAREGSDGWDVWGNQSAVA
jgi:N6-adenosine-specific RNA methylase IME4